MGHRGVLAALLALCLLGVNAQREDCTPLLTAADEAGLTTLLSLLEAAGLQEVLTEEGVNVTIFAPTDEAFSTAFTNLGLTEDLLVEDAGLLSEILSYHVLSSRKSVEQFGTESTEVTLLGEETSCGISSVDVAVEDGTVTIKGGQTSATVQIPDVETCTGVVHVIDFVLLPCPLPGTEEDEPGPPMSPPPPPPTPAQAPAEETEQSPALSPAEAPTEGSCVPLVDAASEEDLNIFLAATEAAGLAGLVTDQITADFTIFAPTDNAFESAVESQGLTLNEFLEDTAMLEEILLYHVLPSRYDRQAFGDGVQLETLLENDSACGISSVDIEAGNAVVVNGGGSSATVEVLDVQTCTAVVHIIDNVLFPCPLTGEPAPEPSQVPPPSSIPATPIETSSSPTLPAAGDCTPFEEAVNEAGLNTFREILDAAGFTEALSDPAADVTIFAPTDEAIATTLEAAGLTADEFVANSDTLEMVLSYHFLAGSYDLEFLVGKMQIETLLEGDSSCGISKVNVEPGDPVVIRGGESNATVEEFDVQTCSATIHIIDNVLLPCSLPVLPPAVAPAPEPQATPPPVAPAPEPEAPPPPVAPAPDAQAPPPPVAPAQEPQVPLPRAPAPTPASGPQPPPSPSKRGTGVVIYPPVAPSQAPAPGPQSPPSPSKRGTGVMIYPPVAPSQAPGPQSSSTPPKQGTGVMIYPPVCTTLEKAAADAGLTTLLKALDSAGLTAEVTQQDNKQTVFAPTDEAFDKFLASEGLTLDDLLANSDMLTEILKFHVLPSPYTMDNFGSGLTIETALGGSSSCDVSAVDVEVGYEVVISGGNSTAVVEEFDVEICSGILHIIDNVLVPCSVKPACETFLEATEDAEIGIFLSALEAVDLLDVIAEDGVSLTVFAPNDEAFNSALNDLGLTIDDLLEDKKQLEGILMYHFLPDGYTVEKFGDGGEKMTLGEGSLCDVSTVDVQVGQPIVIKGGASMAAVLNPDIQTCTAVVHVIDDVLLPCPLQPRPLPPVPLPAPATPPKAVPDPVAPVSIGPMPMPPEPSSPKPMPPGQIRPGVMMTEPSSPPEQAPTGEPSTTLPTGQSPLLPKPPAPTPAPAPMARKTGPIRVVDPEIPAIIAVAKERGLTTFAEWIEAAGLGQELSQEGLTVFVPNNHAFYHLGLHPEQLTRAQAREVLLYHMLKYVARSSELEHHGVLHTALGDESSCGVGDLSIHHHWHTVLLIGGQNHAQIVEADLLAGSSVIHVVDDVLLPCELNIHSPHKPGYKHKDKHRKGSTYSVKKCRWSWDYWWWVCEEVKSYHG